MAGQRVDATSAWAFRWLAGRAGGDALLPAQDTEDKIPRTVLDDRVWLAECVMELCIWRSK